MKIPTLEEIHRLLSAINPRSAFGERDREMLVLMACTGLRVSELCGLDVGLVFSHQLGQARDHLDLPAPLGKGRKTRLVPLNQRARLAVKRLLAFNHKRGFSTAPKAPLLVDRRHKRLTPRYVQRLMKEARERAGIDMRLTPHGLRHYAATEMARGNQALYPVQEVLGHRRITTTRRYLHANRGDLDQVATVLAGQF